MKRKPILAGMLSLLAPGVGQVYCGRLKRGLIFMALVLATLPVTFLLFTAVSPPTTLALWMTIGTYLAIRLIPLLDAMWVAQRIRHDYPPKEYNRVTVYILLWLIFTGSSLGYALHARSQHMEAFRVPSASMYPTIIPNDRLVANKVVYKQTDPQPGDLVVYIPLEHRHQKWIVRVIALAGDTVEIKEGRVLINDQPLARKALPNRILAAIPAHHMGGPLTGQPIDGQVYDETNGPSTYTTIYTRKEAATAGDFPKTTVPPHHCFVLGDNRDNSLDSRHHGPIPLATIIGRVDYLYCPAQDWSRFGPLSAE
ncbi:signal peptidase I [Planctomycetota bacterium]